MKTAEQILKAKGYDNDEINDIINHTPGLDMQVRKEFELDGEPLHLWEAYYRGDAKEEVLEAVAKKYFCTDVNTLLRVMDARLADLCEKVEWEYSRYKKLFKKGVSINHVEYGKGTVIGWTGFIPGSMNVRVQFESGEVRDFSPRKLRDKVLTKS